MLDAVGECDVVGDVEDGEVAGEHLVDDVAGRLAVELGDHLVGEQQRGSVGRRDRQCDSLCLATREVARQVAGPIADAEPLEQLVRPASCCAAIAYGPETERQLDVLGCREERDQVVGLEGDPDALGTEPCRASSSRSCIDCPSISMMPSDGCRSPAMSDSSVDLPLPDGPTRLAFSPGRMQRSTSASTSTSRCLR